MKRTALDELRAALQQANDERTRIDALGRVALPWGAYVRLVLAAETLIRETEEAKA